MNFMEKLRAAWRDHSSLVCVGLDPAIAKLPECLRGRSDALFQFNKAIVDATHDLVCAYKPQAAYYAGQNADDQLKATIDYIRTHYPEVPVILDVKRGDIGETAKMYALEAFERYNADALTVNPYMGGDTLEPFLSRADRGVVVLCRTSNPGSGDFQSLPVGGRKLYEVVAELARDRWNANGNVLLVIGATCPAELAAVRKLCPEMPFLVPGVGAQGGDVAKVVAGGCTADRNGLIINSSRGIIYAGSGSDFAEKSRAATLELRNLINQYRFSA